MEPFYILFAGLGLYLALFLPFAVVWLVILFFMMSVARRVDSILWELARAIQRDAEQKEIERLRQRALRQISRLPTQRRREDYQHRLDRVMSGDAKLNDKLEWV